MVPGYAAVAEQFARALAEGRFEAAHSLITRAQKREVSMENLKQMFGMMTGYAEGPVNHIEVMNTLDDWPTKEASDVGWAYIAMAGDGFSEAVAVVVAEENGEFLIRSVEWGRP